MFVLASMQVNVTPDITWIDYLVIGVYFLVTLGIGFVLRTRMHSSEDFFLSGRSLPSWVTGLAFVGANLGALEYLGHGGKRSSIWHSPGPFLLDRCHPCYGFCGYLHDAILLWKQGALGTWLSQVAL